VADPKILGSTTMVKQLPRLSKIVNFSGRETPSTFNGRITNVAAGAPFGNFYGAWGVTQVSGGTCTSRGLFRCTAAAKLRRVDTALACTYYGEKSARICLLLVFT